MIACGTSGGPSDTDSDATSAGSTGSASSSSASTTGVEPTGGSTGAPSCTATAPDFAAPASSTRSGVAVMSVGPGPRFQLPVEFVAWYEQYGDNLHLTRPELESVRDGVGEWDTEYAYVLTTLLDFDRCAAHVGGEGWGAAAVSFADLQVRAYVVSAQPSEIVAAAQSASWDLVTPTVTVEEGDPWTRVLLEYYNFYGDYGDDANVDLRLRRFDSATLVLAGMYTDMFATDTLADFEALVASTCWQPGTGECCPG